MIELKPRCDGCGTPNAIDAIFCQECGCGLNIEKETSDIPGVLFDDMDPMTIKSHKRDKNGKFINGKCLHQTVVSNLQCECVRCINCDTRTETCTKHIPKFDYGIQTKKKNSLDHLKETLSPKTPFPEDKRLDFRSNQLADWYFKDEAIPCEYKDCIDTKPYHTFHHGSSDDIQVEYDGSTGESKKDFGWKVPIMGGGTVPWDNRGYQKINPPKIPKSTQAIITQIEQAQTWGDKNTSKTTSGLDRPIPIRHIRKPWGGGKCDCDGITTICEEFRAKQEKPPYSSIIGTDVRKGIDGFSRTEKLILNFSFLAIIISLGILIYL